MLLAQGMEWHYKPYVAAIAKGITMPIVEYACPIVVTMDGPREREDRPCDTETRLYLEQCLDRGDAEIIPIIDVEGAIEMGHAPVSHRIVTKTGGVFHARVAEGSRDWPKMRRPDELNFLFVATAAIDRWTRSMETQVMALRLLEAEVAALRRELGR